MDSKHSKITKQIFLITTLFLVIGLIGCSPSDEVATSEIITSENTTSEFTTSASSKTDPVPESAENDHVVITFSTYESSSATIEPLVRAFNEENSSITVQYIPISNSAINESPTIEDRLLLFASSADTTLLSIHSENAGSYFQDLQPLIDADAAFDQADFWPGAVSGMKDKHGQITGLPMTLFMQGIFYNKSAFDAANLPYPQPGWTWDDFRSAAAALAQDERYGFADRERSILQPLVGNSLALNDGDINAEALTDELEWYLAMVQDEQMLGIRNTDEFWSTTFNTDSPPAMWSGTLFDFALGWVTGEPEATDLVTLFTDSTHGFVPFPVDADGENMNTTPHTILYGAISIGSEHPEEAWKWLNFLSEHWLISDTSDTMNQLHIPSRQSTAETEGFWDNYPPEAQAAMQYGLEHAWFTSPYSQAESAILKAVREVAVLNSSLLSALEDAAVQQASWPQEAPDVPEIIIESPETAAPGTAEIYFYHNNFDPQKESAIASLISQFNQEHQDEFIVHQSNSTPNSEEEYIARMTNNYDCFLTTTYGERAYAEKIAASGLTLDLTALMEAEDAAFQQDFDPLLLDYSEYNGSLYALPIFTQPTIMAYNADLLAELGLEPPSPDWTFDEFIELITAVSSASEEAYGFLPNGMVELDITELLYAGRGAQLRDASGDFPVVMFDTPEMVNAMTWIAEQKDSGVIFEANPDENWYGYNAMESGQIGFWIVFATNQEWDYFEFTKPPFNIGIAPLPYTDKPNGFNTHNYDISFYISNKTEHPEACWELAKYISGEANVLEGVPARISIANSDAWEAHVGADNAAVYRASIANNLANAAVDLYGPHFWGSINGWRRQAQNNIENGNDPAEELALAQQYADAYLACMSSYDILNLNYDAMREAAQSCNEQVAPD